MKNNSGAVNTAFLIIVMIVCAGCSLLNQPPQQQPQSPALPAGTTITTAPGTTTQVTATQTTSPVAVSQMQRIENAITTATGIIQKSGDALGSISSTLSNVVTYGGGITASLLAIWGLIKAHKTAVNNSVAAAVNNKTNTG
jgi:hypothetical protein